MKVLSLLIVSVVLAGVSCERHEFDGPEGTRHIHEHGADHAGEHADEHEETSEAH